MLCFRQIFARPTSDMPNSLASVRMGVGQTFLYSSARVRRILLDVIPLVALGRYHSDCAFDIERAARRWDTGQLKGLKRLP
jgi:hypothetical protein